MNSLAGPMLVEALLSYDSADEALGGMRGLGGRSRMLLFKWEHLTVDLLVCDGPGDLFALHGQVTENPAGTPVVGADARAGRAHVETDEHGQFAVMLDGAWTPRSLNIRIRDLAVVCNIPG